MTVGSLLNRGKSLSLAHQWEEAVEILGKLPVEQRWELHRALLQQVWEGSSLQEYGPEKWRPCGTGVSSVDPELEPAAQPK